MMRNLWDNVLGAAMLLVMVLGATSGVFAFIAVAGDTATKEEFRDLFRPAASSETLGDLKMCTVRLDSDLMTITYQYEGADQQVIETEFDGEHTFADELAAWATRQMVADAIGFEGQLEGIDDSRKSEWRSDL